MLPCAQPKCCPESTFISCPVKELEFNINNTASAISFGSVAFFSGTFIYWFLNCLFVCLLLGNVGPGPMALTFILGASERAKVWVSVQRTDLVRV